MDLNWTYPLKTEISANYNKALFLSHPVKEYLSKGWSLLTLQSQPSDTFSLAEKV